MKAYTTAIEAIESAELGARTIKGTYEEAFKLAGLPAKNVNGRDGFYSTPVSLDPRDQTTWNIPVALELQPVLKMIEIIKRKKEV